MALSEEANRALDLLSEEIGEVVKAGPISDDQDRFMIVDAKPDFPFIIHPGWDLVDGLFDGDTRTYTLKRQDGSGSSTPVDDVDEAALDWIAGFLGDRDLAGDVVAKLRSRGLLVDRDPWLDQ